MTPTGSLSSGAGALDEPSQDLRVRRRQVLRQLRSARYLRHLVRAQFDLAVANATISCAELELSLRNVGVPGELAAPLLNPGHAPRSGNNLIELAGLLRHFDGLERQLQAELDQLTGCVIAQLREHPPACLMPPLELASTMMTAEPQRSAQGTGS